MKTLLHAFKNKLRTLTRPPAKIPAGKAIPRRVIEHNGHLLMLMKRSSLSAKQLIMESKNGFDFVPTESMVPMSVIQLPCSAVVAVDEDVHSSVMYFGQRDISMARSLDGHHWIPSTKNLNLRTSARPMEVGGAWQYENSIVLLYYEKRIVDGKSVYEAYFAAFDSHNPARLLWRLDEMVWNSQEEWAGLDVVALGAAQVDDKIVSYWHVDGRITYAVVLSGLHFSRGKLFAPEYQLARHMDNPLISPHDTNEWETFTTFNPAACVIDGRVHILYRAQGYDYISTIGYATSRDGLIIEDRYDSPVYSPAAHFEENTTGRVDESLVSGGGYGGCEDPRISVIDGRVYMVYVAFDGWSPPRLAMTSICIEDFLAKRWNWTKPVLISRPGIIDKSGCILPEKVNGKYVVFHRVFPNILIDYVDDLNFDGKTHFLKGEYEIPIRPHMWDSRKIGVGAPPIRTEHGWLLIYYGVDDRDDSKYHIGAMLLDLNDPTHVLYRSNHPILEPTENYEMNGFKPGIAYPCGAVVMENMLYVYYGAADTHVCVATARLDKFLEELMTDQNIKLAPVDIREVTLP